MKEELTREVLEALAKCSGAEYSKCENCPATKICDYTNGNICKRLATALLEEMDKPKVWDGAPEESVSAIVSWCRSGEVVGSVAYNRELPKTRFQVMAEEIAAALTSSARYEPAVEIIESALEKYAAELGTTT